MSRIYVVVEGHTEEAFVKQILGPSMSAREMFLFPVLLGRARPRSSRGGRVQEDRVVSHVTRLLKQDRRASCTTFFDYYGIDPDFPGRNGSRAIRSTAEMAETVEAALRERVLGEFDSSFAAARFLPYVQMHEFEALLFSNPSELASALGNPDLESSIESIAASFDSPEGIDDSYETKPSARIRSLFPAYRKTYHGILAARRIGLGRIRSVCSHFNDWCLSLESMRGSG